MIVIVAGMHRSGTSALAGTLHTQGVMMGETRWLRPPPSAENPKGFYENIRFRALSDRILEESGYLVKTWSPTIPVVRSTNSTRSQARELLSAYSHEYPLWGWKDPRLCLTLHIWLDELDRLALADEVRLLYIFRSPTHVATSMVQRGNTDYPTALRLWTAYNRYALDTIERHPVETLFVAYDELCHAAQSTAAAVCGFLGIDPHPDAVRGFIDAGLDHSRLAEHPDRATPAVVREARALETELRRRQ